VRDSLAACEPLDLERDATEYAPQVIHSELYCAAVKVEVPKRDSTVVGSLPVNRAPTPGAPVSSSEFPW
jgi:hypothetical protein